MQPIGLRLASILTMEIGNSGLLKQGLDYRQLEEFIYKTVSDLAHDQRVGDWLETPNGTTYTLTFKPAYKNANAAACTMQQLQEVNETL
jgi:hypothetical protein